MENTAPWLLETEEITANLYAEAAEKFTHLPECYDFLMQMSDDEREHVELVESLITFLNKQNSFDPSVTLSSETKKKYRTTLNKSRNRISEGELETSELIEILLSTELSEFNFFMLYMIELAKEIDNSFTPAFVDVQGHLSEVRRFVEKHGSRDDIESLNVLPKVWDEKILIANPSNALINLLDHLMIDEASVTGTSDGHEAFDLIRENYYAAIILEVHIDGLNGKKLYKKLLEVHPRLKERVIFMTSDDSKENLSFFRENDLEFMIKPVRIFHLKEQVTKTIINNRKAC